MAKFKSALLAAAVAYAFVIASPANAAGGDASAYLKCDGTPAVISPGELIGRVVLLTATLGLAGRPQGQDVSQRAHGIDGVDACDAALLQERDSVRKVQLMLARSIHHIETKEYGLAQQDAEGAPSLAGAAAEDIGFRHSLLLSSLDLQAASLVRAGKFAEAEAVALRLANASPYDVSAQLEASAYMLLTGELDPEKQAYLDRLVRIFPQTLALRAIAYQWAGRYLDAAADYASIIELRAAFNTGSEAPPLPDALAIRAAMLALGGKLDESSSVASDAQAMIRVLSASGKGMIMQSSIDAAEEALDFQGIVADLAAGRGGAARMKFAARSHWSVPATPSVAALAAKLRQDAKPDELTGTLAVDPAVMRANGLASNAGVITEASNADASLYNIIRQPMDADTYRAWADDVWNTKSSTLLHKRAANENYAGELLVAPQWTPRFMTGPRMLSMAAGDGLLMHAALLAQARGQRSFELFPLRKQFEAIFVKFGNPGESGMVAATSFDAESVVSDLAVEFPEPRSRAAGGGAAQPVHPF